MLVDRYVCRSRRVCVYVWVYIYICIYVSVYARFCVCVDRYVCRSICVCIYVWVGVCACSSLMVCHDGALLKQPFFPLSGGKVLCLYLDKGLCVRLDMCFQICAFRYVCRPVRQDSFICT